MGRQYHFFEDITEDDVRANLDFAAALVEDDGDAKIEVFRIDDGWQGLWEAGGRRRVSVWDACAREDIAAAWLHAWAVDGALRQSRDSAVSGQPGLVGSTRQRG